MHPFGTDLNLFMSSLPQSQVSCQTSPTSRYIDHHRVCYTMLGPIHLSLHLIMFKPSRSAPSNHQANFFKSQPFSQLSISTSLPAGCHGNLPVLNLLSESVSKNQHFRPAGKTMRWIEKWLTPFRIVTTFSISMQSLGRSNYARRL